MTTFKGGQDQLLRSLPDLKATGVFADVNLYIGVKEPAALRVHRSLLVAAGNGFLREILTDQENEDIHVFFPDFDVKEVEEVLDFIYCISDEHPENDFFRDFFFKPKEPKIENDFENFEDIPDFEPKIEQVELKRKRGKTPIKPPKFIDTEDEEFLWKCENCQQRNPELKRTFEKFVDHVIRERNCNMGNYICECCGQDLKDKDVLLLHNLNVPCVRNTDDEGKFRCQLCPFKSFALGNLQNHVFLQHGDKCRSQVDKRKDGFSCEICHIIIHTVKNLGKHQEMVHGINPFNFNLRYEETFREYWSKYDPIFEELSANDDTKELKIKPEDWIYCEVCQKGFSGRLGFNKHMRRHGEFNCKFCNKKLQTVHEHHDHRRTCHGLFKCNAVKCDEKFKTRGEVKKHLNEVHSNPPLPQTNEKVLVDGRKRFKCDICQLVLSSNKSVNYHKAAFHHTSLPKKFVCEFKNCSYSSNNSGNFAEHRNTHIGHSHFCEICGHGCNSVNQLKKHKAVRHPDKDTVIVCSVCGKVFNNMITMRRHMVGHRKTYSCDLCEKTFNWESSLVSHKNGFHNTERKFRCDYWKCEKAFKTKFHMKRHQKRHGHLNDAKN